MSKINQYLLYAAMGILAFPAHSAGFDCTKASTTVEKMICSNAQLSELDERLATTYKKALHNTLTPSDLKTEQKYWLQEVRDACREAACLTAAYNLRLEQLESGGGLSGEYQRNSEPNNASITIKPVEYQQFHITGQAVWVGNPETGNVNTGELDGLAELNNQQLHYQDGNDESACKLTLSFAKNVLIVNDDTGYCGGVNVNFNGEYQKVSKKTR